MVKYLITSLIEESLILLSLMPPDHHLKKGKWKKQVRRAGFLTMFRHLQIYTWIEIEF